MISHPYAGITRIRFKGYDLSPFFWGTPDFSAKLIVQSSKWGEKILNFEFWILNLFGTRNPEPGIILCPASVILLQNVSPASNVGCQKQATKICRWSWNRKLPEFLRWHCVRGDPGIRQGWFRSGILNFLLLQWLFPWNGCIMAWGCRCKKYFWMIWYAPGPAIKYKAPFRDVQPSRYNHGFPMHPVRCRHRRCKPGIPSDRRRWWTGRWTGRCEGF